MRCPRNLLKVLFKMKSFKFTPKDKQNCTICVDGERLHEARTRMHETNIHNESVNYIPVFQLPPSDKPNVAVFFTVLILVHTRDKNTGKGIQCKLEGEHSVECKTSAANTARSLK